jgi:hypothetical protein
VNELAYLVVEVGPKTYVYDSVLKHSVEFDQDFSGKRDLLVEYNKIIQVSEFTSIYEYALPSGRSQLVAWYMKRDRNEHSGT